MESFILLLGYSWEGMVKLGEAQGMAAPYRLFLGIRDWDWDERAEKRVIREGICSPLGKRPFEVGVAFALSFGGLWACSGSQNPEANAPAEESREGTSTKEASLSPSIYQLLDPRGRYALSARSLGRPELLLETGYSRFAIRRQDAGAIQCFVYESAIDPGRAVISVARALEVEVDFIAFDLMPAELIDGSAMMALTMRYRSNSSRASAEGELQLALYLREEFPLVCTLDEAGAREGFLTLGREVFQSFSLSEPAAESGDRTYSSLSAGQLEGFAVSGESRRGGLTTSFYSESYFFVEDGKLRTVDSRGSRTDDAEGLLNARWIYSEQTDVVVDLSLDRGKSEVDTSFRYLLSGSRDPTRVHQEVQPQLLPWEEEALHLDGSVLKTLMGEGILREGAMARREKIQRTLLSAPARKSLETRSSGADTPANSNSR